MRMSRRSGLLRKAAPKGYEVAYVAMDSYAWPDSPCDQGTIGTYLVGDSVTVPASMQCYHPDYGRGYFEFVSVYKYATREVYATSMTFTMPAFAVYVLYEYA